MDARLPFAKRVASGRETYGGMPKDPPHAAIAMGRLGCRVREQELGPRCQKWLFFTFRLKIRYILRRSAPPSRAPYHRVAQPGRALVRSSGLYFSRFQSVCVWGGLISLSLLAATSVCLATVHPQSVKRSPDVQCLTHSTPTATQPFMQLRRRPQV